MPANLCFSSTIHDTSTPCYFLSSKVLPGLPFLVDQTRQHCTQDSRGLAPAGHILPHPHTVLWKTGMLNSSSLIWLCVVHAPIWINAVFFIPAPFQTILPCGGYDVLVEIHEPPKLYPNVSMYAHFSEKGACLAIRFLKRVHTPPPSYTDLVAFRRNVN